MRLFLYYAAHTFKNQLKKIFKSWVLIFILACALVGGLIGFTAAKIGSMVQDRHLRRKSLLRQKRMLLKKQKRMTG